MIELENEGKIIQYHLPGLYEFYDFYLKFLPIFFHNRGYFYEWCTIGSIYGAPNDCIWSGGRIEIGNANTSDVISLLEQYGISARLTFSNSLLLNEHLSDRFCNMICDEFNASAVANGIIINSDILLKYLKEKYPDFYYVSSTTKVITDFDNLVKEVDNNDFSFVVPDFRLNKNPDLLNNLTEWQKDKIELLCNECCSFYCNNRKQCYENVCRIALGYENDDFKCYSPDSSLGYRFSTAMKNPGFISIDDIRNVYVPMGFSNFKIEGRGLGSAYLLEFILYYMTKPEFHINIREELYLKNNLDLF